MSSEFARVSKHRVYEQEVMQWIDGIRILPTMQRGCLYVKHLNAIKRLLSNGKIKETVNRSGPVEYRKYERV